MAVPTVVDQVVGSITFRNGGAAGTTGETGFARFEVSGPGIGANPLAAFCIEILESVGTATHTYANTDLLRLSARGTADGTAATFNIAGGVNGGIGSTRAEDVNALFWLFYRPNSNDTYWTEAVAFTAVPTGAGTNPQNITVNAARRHAFQLALWELSHDDDGNLNTGTFSIFASDNTGYGTGTGGNNGRRMNAIKSLAQEWVTAARNATGIPSFAHVLISDSNVTGATTFVQDLAIPEPRTAALAAALIALTLTLARRRC